MSNWTNEGQEGMTGFCGLGLAGARASREPKRERTSDISRFSNKLDDRSSNWWQNVSPFTRNTFEKITEKIQPEHFNKMTRNTWGHQGTDSISNLLKTRVHCESSQGTLTILNDGQFKTATVNEGFFDCVRFIVTRERSIWNWTFGF